jgi:SAM-dependent methyltransferase
MGKKARLKKERRDGAAPDRPSATQLVDRYLRAINAPATIVDRAEFWDWLDARNGAESAYLSDVLDGVVEDSKWGARCATLRLGIDHQFGFSGRLYRPLLRALAQRLRDTEYGSVLDAGCENGLVGCFAASVRPGIRLAGIDLEGRALHSGAELAAELALDARFIEADITAPEWPVDGPFDIVLSMRALVGNALRQPDFTAKDQTLNEILGRIRELLADDGRYIAFERLSSAEASHCFATAAAKQGLTLDDEQSTVVVVEEIPETVERIPLLVFRPAEDATPPRMALLDDLHVRAARAAGAAP